MSAELPESSISDEAWERFQRESEGPARLTAPKEPSARARMVAERLRRADEEAARQQGRARGRGKNARVRAEPDAWRAWQTRGTRHTRRSRVPGIAWVVVAVVVVLLVMNPQRTFWWLY